MRDKSINQIFADELKLESLSFNDYIMKRNHNSYIKDYIKKRNNEDLRQKARTLLKEMTYLN
jgi:hypothetical protein